MTIQEALTELMERRGLTQSQFASRLGIFQPNLSKILSGKQILSAQMKQKVESVFGVKLIESARFVDVNMNELSTLVFADGQLIRSFYIYLQESMFQLDGHTEPFSGQVMTRDVLINALKTSIDILIKDETE